MGQVGRLTSHVSVGFDCKDSISYEEKDWESKKTPDNGFLALAIWAVHHMGVWLQLML